MKKKILLVLIILIFVASGFIGGFNLGKRSLRPEIIYRLDPEKSTLVANRYFYFTGQAREIDVSNRTITLANSGESIKIEIKQGVSVVSYAFRQDDKTPNEQPKTVGLKDMKVGDKVSIYVEVQKDGKLLGTSVYIHYVPVKAF